MVGPPAASSPVGLQPPPSLPNVPGLNDQLANYLRSFALWCRHGFAAKLSSTTALPGIMLLANDGSGKVFLLQVDGTGAPVATPMPLGIGAP
jgi:hypothetical protein